MKKTTLLLAAGIMLLACPDGVFAQVSPYAGASIGYETSKESYTDDPYAKDVIKKELFSARGIAYGFFAGADLTDRIRAEAEYTYKNFKNNGDGFAQGDIKQQTIMANMFIYPFKRLIVSPYVGAGAGWGFAHMDGARRADNFAFALYLGADYKISDKVALDLQGNLNSITNPYKSDYFYNITNFGIKTGLRYNF